MNNMHTKKEYPLSAITDRILAAAIRVHKELGPGFQEVIYQRALALELKAQTLDFSREVWIDVYYRNEKIGKKRVDFIIEGVMVEIKAHSCLEPVAYVQALSYLKASGFNVGLLLNFGNPRLEIKRLVYTV